MIHQVTRGHAKRSRNEQAYLMQEIRGHVQGGGGKNDHEIKNGARHETIPSLF